MHLGLIDQIESCLSLSTILENDKIKKKPIILINKACLIKIDKIKFAPSTVWKVRVTMVRKVWQIESNRNYVICWCCGCWHCAAASCYGSWSCSIIGACTLIKCILPLMAAPFVRASAAAHLSTRRVAFLLFIREAKVINVRRTCVAHSGLV